MLNRSSVTRAAMKVIPSLLCLVSTLLPGGLCRAAPPKPVALRIDVDGVMRRAVVYPGRDAAATPSPLVLGIHGFSGSPEIAAGYMNFQTAWPEATVVYPAGNSVRLQILASVNSGWQTMPGAYRDRDLRFIDALLKNVTETYRVDPRRIYVTGLSNGGAFTYLLLRTRPDLFAAFAPVAGWAEPHLKGATVPRPVLMVHGKADTVVLPGANEEALASIRELNGCGGESIEWASGYQVWPACASGQPVVWNLHAGGHGWTPDATTRIVRFFQENVRSEPAILPTSPAPMDPRAGFFGDSGPATAAQLLSPQGVIADSSGNLYILDAGNARVRRIGPDGAIVTVAGNGDWGTARNGQDANRAPLALPTGIALDSTGVLYVSEAYNSRVLKAGSDGKIAIVAGTGRSGFSGDGAAAAKAALSYPTALAVGESGSLTIADSRNHRVRRVTPDGTISTVAGTGQAGFSGDGGAATLAALDHPSGLAAGEDGSLYIADTYNHRVRRLARDGTIATVAGTGKAGFNGESAPALSMDLSMPLGLARDAQGRLLIADSHNRRVRRLETDGTLVTVGGSASWDLPTAVAVDPDGRLLVADAGTHRVTAVASDGTASVVAGGRLSGDLNADGRIDGADVVRILRAVAGPEPLPTETRPIADVNGDGKTDRTDAILLLRRWVGL